jgi:hypothetical protein
MLSKCFAFFEELTDSIVVSSQQRENSNILKRIGNEFSEGSVLQNNYLYSDAYKLNLAKLIPLAQQEKLKEAYGENWLEVVNGMYKKIERDLHDGTIRKFGGLVSSEVEVE